MHLEYNPSSNVAIPLFFPDADSGISVEFDVDEKLYIEGGVDDTKPYDASPAYAGDVYNWYVCETHWGYTYPTLAWVLGIEAPQNPSCQKVDVVRVFI